MQSNMHNPIGITTATLANEDWTAQTISFHDNRNNDICIFYADEQIELKLADHKEKIELSKIMKAVAEAFNGKEFWLDEIDELIYKYQNEIEELKNHNRVLKDLLR